MKSLRRLVVPALFSLILVAACTGGDAEAPTMEAAPETTEPSAPGAPVSRSAAADDAICNAPASTVLIPIPPGGTGSAPINVKVHYNRPDGQYAGWGLHVWQINDASQFIGDYPGVTFPQPLAPAGFDDFGPFFQIEAAKFTNAQAAGFGFIVHQGDNKDPDGDRFWMFSGGAEIWLRSGDSTIYLSPSGTPAGTNKTSTVDARAVWLTRALLRWPRVDGTGQFRLYHSATGQIIARAGQRITGADGALPLTVFTGELPPAIAERFKFVGAGVTLALAPADSVDPVLSNQLVVVQEDAGGNVLGATTAQLPGLLDDRFAVAAHVPDLGATVRHDRTQLKVWAPTAQRVSLCTYDRHGTALAGPLAMTRDGATGVWSLALHGDRSGQYYRYAVEVFVRGVGLVRNLVTDPYSISLDANSQRSYIADLDARALKPHGWDGDRAPSTAPRQEDMTIYELHVRDFSVNDRTVPAAHRGKFLAFTDRDSAGMRHLRALARAGLTDVHLLPVFDIATIPELGCVNPVIADAAPDSEAQQAAVNAVRDQDCFNWGYDPFHYTSPEGSYATDPTDGASRIREMRAMVLALHGAGLRVGMDVVYNHTSASGQSDRSVLDRVVPGYYHRLNATGDVEHATCCENTAAENLMMGKLMIESVVTWATQYNVDSFRFDLMSFHPRPLMQQLQARVEAATGRDIFIIGEGWNFGEVADGARFVQSSQLSLNGSGIGTFSDRARDFIRGGGPFDGGQSLIQNQGFVNGLFYDDNGSGGGKTLADLLRAGDMVKVGLAGSIRDYPLVTATDEVRELQQIDYNGQPAGYVLDPQEVVNYMENHDNQTLFDNNVYKLPLSTSREDRARVQLLAAALTAFSQGVAYFHAGVDTLRSKSMDRNSFNSGDWFNRLDWSYTDNNFGVGLPLQGDNGDNWPLIKPLLANPAIKPRPEDIRWTRDAFRDLLEIRASSPLFHLPTGEAIKQRLVFYNTGSLQEPTVIAGHVDGRGIRHAEDDLIYFVNVDKVPHTLTISAERNKRYGLHPVHRRFDAADRCPATSARYDRTTGAFTIPPRTAVVFVAD